MQDWKLYRKAALKAEQDETESFCSNTDSIELFAKATLQRISLLYKAHVPEYDPMATGFFNGRYELPRLDHLYTSRKRDCNTSVP